MNIIESFLTKNPFYKAGRKITVKGGMLHSVGCPQPKASVFVKNWNKETYTRACVHAFIDANTGDIYQTLPWNHRAGHAGGSANNTHIGVEMCEPSCIKYTKGANFTCSDLEAARAAVTRTYLAAVELFAMFCKEYDLDPLSPGVIISHREGGKLGTASAHADPEHLWKGLGMSYTMDTFRKAVSDKMNESKPNNRVQVNATTKTTGTKGNVSISLPILCKGSKGEAVKTLQRLLNAHGFADATEKALAVDGSFGAATLYALKNYQDQNKLEVDGYCGANTWKSLLT